LLIQNIKEYNIKDIFYISL